MTTAEQYRQLARGSTLLKMAEEYDQLADQQKQAIDLRQERSKRARRREICPIPEPLHEDRQKQP